jgi:hypothetical protein
MNVEHLLEEIFISINFLSQILSEVKQPLGLLLNQAHQNMQLTYTK